MNSLVKNFITKIWTKQEAYQSLDAYYQKVFNFNLIKNVVQSEIISPFNNFLKALKTRQ